MKKTLIVNLFGGPGSGKSTGAAYIFAKLKMLGINAELVTEVAKDLTWEKSFKNLTDQVLLFGKQQHRLFRCADEVDVIVTDSPIFLTMVYNNDDSIHISLDNLVLDVMDKYDNYNVLLKREKPYNPIGRNQTEEESDELTRKITNLLNHYHIKYDTEDGWINGYDHIVEKVLERMDYQGA